MPAQAGARSSMKQKLTRSLSSNQWSVDVEAMNNGVQITSLPSLTIMCISFSLFYISPLFIFWNSLFVTVYSVPKSIPVIQQKHWVVPRQLFHVFRVSLFPSYYFPFLPYLLFPFLFSKNGAKSRETIHLRKCKLVFTNPFYLQTWCSRGSEKCGSLFFMILFL